MRVVFVLRSAEVQPSFHDLCGVKCKEKFLVRPIVFAQVKFRSPRMAQAMQNAWLGSGKMPRHYVPFGPHLPEWNWGKSTLDQLDWPKLCKRHGLAVAEMSRLARVLFGLHVHSDVGKLSQSEMIWAYVRELVFLGWASMSDQEGEV